MTEPAPLRQHPFRNRVTPFGAIVATPERGLFLGNRGCIHNAAGDLLRRQWAVQRWIACLLEFKGRRQPLLNPGHYTHLFFLDEAVALAAGHRPCGECRRSEFDRFVALWLAANPDRGILPRERIERLDAALHTDRLTDEGAKRRYPARLGDLPDGTFVAIASGVDAWLVWHGALRLWSPGGYTLRRRVESGMEVAVLTPRSVVLTIAAGYTPIVHPSAAG